MVPHFTSDAAALLLIDYQVGTLQLARTTPADVAVRNAVMLAKAALAYKMPIVMTSSQEDQLQQQIDGQLQRVAPDAFAARVKRQGIVDAWRDPAFKAAVERTGRRQLIMGAITTHICLVFPAVSAVEDGYEVQAVMDACGSPYPIQEEMSRERLRAGGVHMTVTPTIIAELVRDWSTPEGSELIQLIGADPPMLMVE